MGSKNIPGEPREQLAPASVRQVCREPGASRLGLRWRAGSSRWHVFSKEKELLANMRKYSH